MLQKIIATKTSQLDFMYGPDEQRKKTILLNNSVLQSTRFFSGDYEKTISAGNTTEVHYINCAAGIAAMYVVENGNGTMYFPYTDYLGSILTVTDQQGNITAEQSFDAWGRNRRHDDWTGQNIPTVPSWLYRGFTGHEHLPPFALINMNGRMYDPVVGRMLSPDNNLQSPDYSQNHNKYSYALNNPLKFTDPSGNAYDWMGGSSWDDYGSWTGWFDREFNTTSEFDREHFRGTGSMGYTYASGANFSHKPVWTGSQFVTDFPTYNPETGGYGIWFQPTRPSSDVEGVDYSRRFIPYAEEGTGGSDGLPSVKSTYISNTLTFEGVPLIISNKLDYGAAFTLPGIGIFVHPSQQKNIDLLRHEFGHILQARLWGTDFYYSTIAPASYESYRIEKGGKYPQFHHRETWTEWSASYLSYMYFGKPEKWKMGRFPIYPGSSFRPPVGPGRELPHKWMYGTLPQGILTIPKR